ncbi:MAG: hypothetical protein ACRDL3_03510 [Solirubrobacterales bacterium]
MRLSTIAGSRGPTTRVVLAAALLALAAAAGAAGASGAGGPGGGDRKKELPRGGTSVFPDFRVVAFAGAPQARGLGILGIGSPKRAAKRLRRQAKPYESGEKPVLPAFELIATIALASPGPGGKYRRRQSKGTIRRYLRAARRARDLLVLDIQPGRSTFIKEVQKLRGFLRKPEVGIALDPEWNMGPGGVPGERVGSVGAGMVNRVARFMSGMVRKHDLPEKLLVVHQFTEAMIRNEAGIKTPPGVAVTLNSDGFGTPAQKRARYKDLAPTGGGKHPGFKLFFQEDTNLMSPAQVMGLNPRPEFVVYE